MKIVVEPFKQWVTNRRRELLAAMTDEVKRQVPEKYAYFAGEVAAFSKVLNYLQMQEVSDAGLADLVQPLEPPLEMDPQ